MKLLSVVVAAVLFALSNPAQADFNDSGSATFPTLKTRGLAPTSISESADGKIRMVSMVNAEKGSFGSFIGIAQINGDGTPDKTFGKDGVAQYQAPGAIVTLPGQNHLFQSDGKLILFGSAFSGDLDTTISRFNEDGTLDETFGLEGSTEMDIDFGSQDFAQQIIVRPDDKIWMLGNTRANFTDPRDWFLVLFTANGKPDLSFQAGGIRLLKASEFGNVQKLMLQKDGSLLIISQSLEAGKPQRFAMRLKENGDVDKSFGVDGSATISVNNKEFPETLISRTDAAGNIYFAGTRTIDEDGDFIVRRYTPDFKLDESFGDNGIKVIDLSFCSNDGLVSIDIDPKGRILLFGSAQPMDPLVDPADPSLPPPKKQTAMVRLLPDGTIDNTFGIKGRSITGGAPAAGDSYSWTIQSDSKPLLGMSATDLVTQDTTFRAFRFRENGTLEIK